MKPVLKVRVSFPRDIFKVFVWFNFVRNRNAQLLPRATALSYSAGHNDFDSMNNFAKGEESGEGSKILDATKEVIGEANVQLKKAVSLLTES